MQAALQMSWDEGHVVRLAAARAGGFLSLAELRGELPAGAALALLVPLFVCLLGTDQSSDVQRQQLHVRPQHSRCLTVIVWFPVGRHRAGTVRAASFVPAAADVAPFIQLSQWNSCILHDFPSSSSSKSHTWSYLPLKFWH